MDLVVYATPDGPEGDYWLAHKTKGWREADPAGLVAHVDTYRSSFKDTEDNATKTDQFRRCVRYLRRWNDVRMPFEAKHKPSGLALVLCATTYGLASAKSVDQRPKDLIALRGLVGTVSGTSARIEAKKPTPEYEDMFGRLSDAQMNSLRSNFGKLRDSLDEADSVADPVDACKTLRGVFGDDFPVPDPEETGKKTSGPAVVPSVSSA